MSAQGEKGPKALLNEATGVSTLVTRSLGDPLGATALSSEPDVVFQASVPDGSRIVIASHGILLNIPPPRALRPRHAPNQPFNSKNNNKDTFLGT